MKRAAVLVFRQTKEVLQVRVLQNIAKRLAVVGAKTFLDDEGAECDANRNRLLTFEALFEVLRILLFELLPRNHLG